MKKSIYKLVFLALISVFAFASCQEEDSATDSSSKISLSIDVAGLSTGGEESLTKSAIDSIAIPDTVVQDLGDGLSLQYILTPDASSLTKTTTPMVAGTKYRVVAYDPSGVYVDEAVFTAGTPGTLSLPLLSSGSYTLVALSYNTTTDPGVIGSSATTLTADPSVDLLHWVGSVAATTSGTSAISITFKHRFTKITLLADASLTGNNITALSSATLTPGYQGV